MAKSTGKVALVTGSTDGVGRFVAKRLAESGVKVLVHGRDRARGESLLAEIGKAGGAAEFIAADLASLAEVQRLAHVVAQKTQRLDILINNAGIGTSGSTNRRELSADGHELRFAVNYLSGYLLTRLLLPLVKKSAPARIVNVSSIGQQALDFDDVMLTRNYGGARAYCQSKLAQIMFTIDLAAELKGSGVTVTSLHPATYMDTTMVRLAGVSPMNTVDTGGEAILNLALSSETEGKTGVFYNGLREARADAQAYDGSARAKLAELSAKLTGLSRVEATQPA